MREVLGARTIEHTKLAAAAEGAPVPCRAGPAEVRGLGDPVITEIAAQTGRTPAQVVLRWHIQRGTIVFPKSTTPSRIAENFELFDFELDEEDVERISSLDRGAAGRRGADPDTFAWVP
jgi:2,5-diketo-D-gluconate reductase A